MLHLWDNSLLISSFYLVLGQFLQEHHLRIFWIPCDAHCFDLMLKDIGKMPRVKRALGRGQYLVGFIYNHTSTFNMMRTYTNKTKLVGSRVSRFASTFLILQRLQKQKTNLRNMFTSEGIG